MFDLHPKLSPQRISKLSKPPRHSTLDVQKYYLENNRISGIPSSQKNSRINIDSKNKLESVHIPLEQRPLAKIIDHSISQKLFDGFLLEKSSRNNLRLEQTLKQYTIIRAKYCKSQFIQNGLLLDQKQWKVAKEKKERKIKHLSKLASDSLPQLNRIFKQQRKQFFKVHPQLQERQNLRLLYEQQDRRKNLMKLQQQYINMANKQTNSIYGRKLN